jgi:hypothetical protein
VTGFVVMRWNSRAEAQPWPPSPGWHARCFRSILRPQNAVLPLSGRSGPERERARVQVLVGSPPPAASKYAQFYFNNGWVFLRESMALAALQLGPRADKCVGQRSPVCEKIVSSTLSAQRGGKSVNAYRDACNAVAGPFTADHGPPRGGRKHEHNRQAARSASLYPRSWTIQLGAEQ